MDDRHFEIAESRPTQRWRGPTISEIARVSGVGSATVDRVLNERGGVREVTRQKVLDAVERLTRHAESGPDLSKQSSVRVTFLVESGATFNRTLQEASEAYCRDNNTIAYRFASTPTSDVDPIKFAQQIERAAEESDGLVVVAREDLTINRAIRSVTARGVPVVCITTDLPNSSRLTYVGNEQSNAGATAAYLMGRLVGRVPGNILLVYSAPYRSQEEREIGFRRVLRAEFPKLEIVERVNSKDEPDYIYQSIAKYIDEHGPPAGVYGVSGGNTGIAQVLRDKGLKESVVFIGHELNANSHALLETGGMDFVISHDYAREVALSVRAIEAHLNGEPVQSVNLTDIQVFTKYNCNQ